MFITLRITDIFILLTIAFLTCMPVSGQNKIKPAKGQVSFVSKHKSSFSIVIPDKPVKLVFPEGESIKYAAQFLNKYLDKVCGMKLPIVKESEITSSRNKLFLGATKYAGKHIDLSKLKPEELVIKIAKNSIIICGEISDTGLDRGTLFGIYEFCERFLKVRWYYPDDSFYKKGAGIITPKQKNINLPFMEVRDYPKSTQREQLITYSHYKKKKPKLYREWHPVLRFGNTRKHKTANHTQNTWFKIYHKTHPEYFGKNYDGSIRLNPRINSICFSSDAVLRQMMKNIEAWDTKRTPGLFGWRTTRTPDKNCVYFCPSDNLMPYRGCKCLKCRKRYTPKRGYPGHMSNVVFEFIRRYALAINKRWPGRRLAVLAYASYILPPKNIKIPKNVDVTIVYKNIEKLNDPEKYKQVIAFVDGWLKLLNNNPERISFWYNNITHNMTSLGPLTLSPSFKRFLKDIAKKGIVGKHFFCSYDPYRKRKSYTASQIVASIQSYPEVFFLSKLLWNPDKNINEMLKDYCKNMYGPASDAIYDFYQIIYRRGTKFYESKLGMDKKALFNEVKYPLSVINKLQNLLAKAESQTIKGSMPYYRVRFLAKFLFPPFAAEVKKYLESSPKNVYTCYLSDSGVKVDGKLDEPVWQMLPAIKLRSFPFGQAASAKSEIRLFRTKDSIYIGASFYKHPKTKKVDIAKEELLIQIAQRLKNNDQPYAPNINKRWKDFVEYRINSKGNIWIYNKRNVKITLKYPCKTSVKNDILYIEAKFPIKIFKTPVAIVQFVRYWGIWNKFYTWTPSLDTVVGDYATKNFGIIMFLQKAKKRYTGLE